MAKQAGNLQGCLELLILRALDRSPGHGFGIVAQVAEASNGLLQIEEGSLYPALHRLERQKFVVGAWQTTKKGRRAKFYSLTPAGRTRLVEVRANWKIVAKGVKRVLRFKE